jgi:hypothetical protein
MIQNRIEICQIATKKQPIMFDMIQTVKNTHNEKIVYSHQVVNSELIPNNHISFFYPEEHKFNRSEFSEKTIETK